MDPYKAGLMKKVPFSEKRKVFASLVAIMDMKVEKRGLQLILPFTRALLKGEIHELIITDEKDARPGERVDNISCLGFVEIERGGVVAVGDKVILEKRVVGKVVGFDKTHMPNHWNIVIRSPTKATGKELGACLEGEVVFG